MKPPLLISFLSLLFCACSRNHLPSFDRVQAGKDLIFGHYTMRVDKRNGISVEGIQIVSKGDDGQITKVTAKTGTLSSGTQSHTFTLTIKDARIASPKQTATCDTLTLVLPER